MAHFFKKKKKVPETFKFCQSGEILPNLVTLGSIPGVAKDCHLAGFLVLSLWEETYDLKVVSLNPSIVFCMDIFSH